MREQERAEGFRANTGQKENWIEPFTLTVISTEIKVLKKSEHGTKGTGSEDLYSLLNNNEYFVKNSKL